MHREGEIMNKRIVTPYQCVWIPKAAREASAAASGTFFGILLVVALLSKKLSWIGALIYQQSVFWYLAGVVVVSAAMYIFVYWWVLHRRFCRDFAKEPSCYNCGYPNSGILVKPEQTTDSPRVITCTECGAACPVVFFSEGRLLPLL